MASDIKAYPEYKESSLAWLGRIPKDWSLQRAKWLFRKVERSVRPEDEVVTCFRDGVVTLRKNRRLRGFTESLKEIGYQGIRKGDLVIHQMDAFAGAIGVSDSDGKGTPVYSVCQAKRGSNPHYYVHIVREMARTRWILALAKGIRERSTDFRFDTFAQQIVPIPSGIEQAKIAQFLAHKDKGFNHLIRAKRRIIALLNEQKQAIIHRAVTRGLDASVPLKPSGIPWLGEIPKHWEIMPLKRIAWFKGGAGFPVHEQGKQNLEIPFLKVSDMTRVGNHKWMETSNNTISLESALRLGLFVFPAGTVIFPKVGGALLTNKRRILRKPSCIDNNLMGCMIKWGNPDFVFLILQELDLGRLSKPGPVPAISDGEVREIRITLPPKDEQSELVLFVQRETEALDAAIARVEKEIALIREYRARLVADVVTGQIDLRGVSIPDKAESELEKGEAIEENEVVEDEPANEVATESNDN
jgi:type I restriction enzyme S subunit